LHHGTDWFGASTVGKKKKKKLGDTPAETVKLWTKAGKVKKKCCQSKSRCGKCPVLALKKAKKELAKAA
jgi:hypothetical protein